MKRQRRKRRAKGDRHLHVAAMLCFIRGSEGDDYPSVGTRAEGIPVHDCEGEPGFRGIAGP